MTFRGFRIFVLNLLGLRFEPDFLGFNWDLDFPRAPPSPTTHRIADRRRTINEPRGTRTLSGIQAGSTPTR